ncbi:MAG TPA: TonB-dependent receptor [Granulicella sp.]
MSSPFRRIGLVALLVLFVLPCCVSRSALAQTTATIEGVISDVQGGTIPNATVTVTNTSTGLARTVTTDAGGRYAVPQLNPGTYKVDAEAQGFKKTTLAGITLNIAQVQHEDIAIQVGGSNETVNVEAQALTTETESSSVGQVIDNKKVVELPLANRQFYNLAELSPGVVPPAQNSSLGFRGGFNVNGAPETDNQFLVNGTFNNDMGTNQPSFRPSVETIAEFKVLSGVYSAEYGRFAGGQIVMVTKQGGNQFHGSAYEFIRNGAIEAKPWSSSAQTTTPAFKQNTFGVTVGGPVIRDKAFFFFGYEGQRIRQQVVASSTVPTPWALAGCLPSSTQAYNPYTGEALALTSGGACASAPGAGYDITTIADANSTNLWNSPAGKLSQLMTSLAYPLPNVSGYTGQLSNVQPGSDYLFSETRRESSNAYNVRGDYKYSEKDSFYGTWNYFNDPSYEPSNSLCSSRTLPNFGCFTNQQSTLANVGNIHIFNPSLLNDIRFGFSRLVQPRIQEDNTTIGSAWPGLAGAFTQAGVTDNLGLPSITLQNYTATGGQTNLPQNRWTDHWQFSNVLSWTRGAHSLKFGFDMTDVKSTNYEVTTGRGSLTFNASTLNTINGSNHRGTTNNAVGDILLGLPSSTSDTPTAPLTYLRFTSFDFFVQDDWKVTPSLTVNLGMRYELNSPMSEKYGNIATFSPLTQNFTVANQAGVRTVYQYDRNNFAPRVGFAWQPFGNDRTVVKGGYGVFYQEPIMYNEFLSYGLQYPVRYPKTFTPGAAGNTIGNGNITLDQPFPNELPIPGTPYCVKGSTGCNNPVIGQQCGSLASNCSLIPVVTGTEVDPKYATPYWHEWTLSVQKQLTSTMVGEVGYYGSKGSKINSNAPINYNTLGVSAAATATTQSQRIYPQWGTINIHKTGYDSEYESLFSRLQMNTGKGINFLISYTYGKSLDDLNSAQNPNPNYVDPNTGKAGTQSGDRALSSFDTRQRLVFSPVVELPFGKDHKWLTTGIPSAIAGGWQISGIVQWMTGRPISISDSTVSSGSYGGGDRPNIYGNINGSTDSLTGAKTHTAAEWFNIHAVNWNGSTAAPRKAGTFGNANPAPITAPGYVTVDATIARTFPIKDTVKAQFRVEGFNVLNHPNFAAPSGSFSGTYTSYGVITSANNMRELQASLIIRF